MSTLTTPTRGSTQRRDLDPDPDLRAVFDRRKLSVIPWARACCNGAATISGQPAFELWLGQGSVHARQLGAGSADGAIARLRRWAREERLGELQLGAPLPPAAGQPYAGRAPIVIPRDHAVEPARFEFVYPDPHRARPALRIVPAGLTGTRTDRLSRPWRGAVGQVHVYSQDPNQAQVRFAHLDSGWRNGATEALERWAAADGWELQVIAGLLPLAVSTRPAHPTSPSQCRGCGSSARADRAGFAIRGWHPTRCECGGRRRWD